MFHESYYFFHNFLVLAISGMHSQSSVWLRVLIFYYRMNSVVSRNSARFFSLGIS